MFNEVLDEFISHLIIVIFLLIYSLIWVREVFWRTDSYYP